MSKTKSNVTTKQPVQPKAQSGLLPHQERKRIQLTKLEGEMNKKFWKLFFAGLAIQAICTQLQINKAILRTAYPDLDWGRRGSVRPKFMSQERWKLRKSFESNEAWKEFQTKENHLLRSISKTSAVAVRKLRRTMNTEDWKVEVETNYATISNN